MITRGDGVGGRVLQHEKKRVLATRSHLAQARTHPSASDGWVEKVRPESDGAAGAGKSDDLGSRECDAATVEVELDEGGGDRLVRGENDLHDRAREVLAVLRDESESVEPLDDEELEIGRAHV